MCGSPVLWPVAPQEFRRIQKFSDCFKTRAGRNPQASTPEQASQNSGHARPARQHRGQDVMNINSFGAVVDRAGIGLLHVSSAVRIEIVPATRASSLPQRGGRLMRCIASGLALLAITACSSQPAQLNSTVAAQSPQTQAERATLAAALDAENRAGAANLASAAAGLPAGAPTRRLSRWQRCASSGTGSSTRMARPSTATTHPLRARACARKPCVSPRSNGTTSAETRRVKWKGCSATRFHVHQGPSKAAAGGDRVDV